MTAAPGFSPKTLLSYEADPMRYTEQQMTSELLDQPAFTGEPRKLFICSTPRSGSYLLCRYMINAGLGVPHEYFNPIIMRQMAPRFGLGPAVAELKWRPRSRMDRLPFATPARAAEESFLGQYLAALIPKRCQGGIFAAKIHFEHFVKVLDNPTGRKLLDGGVFIHLYRDDLLKQAVSTHFSNLTGRWSIDDTRSTAPAAQPNFFDAAALDRTLHRLAEDDLGWRVLLARNGLGPLSISYEQLCKDPAGFVATIARRMGVDPATLRQGYNEPANPPTEAEPGLPSRSEVARRYVAAYRTLQPAAPARAAESAVPSGLQRAGE
jgi:LPS sulfotransferase NodH